MKLYFGCSQWGYESWRGTLYPEDSHPSDFLRIYAGMFNSVELNSTFYNGAEPSNLLRWKNKIKPGFKFCPKIPRIISHEKRFVGIDDELRSFLSGINILGSSLGTTFLQLSNSFSYEEINKFETFLTKYPSEVQLSIEPRIHIIQDRRYLDALLNVIRENRRGVVITDTIDTHPYLNSIRLTNHMAFIRFIAYGHETDHMRIDEWFGQLDKWREKGLPTAYFFLHFPSELNDPGLIQYFLKRADEFEMN
jgi:uncharacterized protein YecE (DUF72 family)